MQTRRAAVNGGGKHPKCPRLNPAAKGATVNFFLPRPFSFLLCSYMFCSRSHTLSPPTRLILLCLLLTTAASATVGAGGSSTTSILLADLDLAAAASAGAGDPTTTATQPPKSTLQVLVALEVLLVVALVPPGWSLFTRSTIGTYSRAQMPLRNWRNSFQIWRKSSSFQMTP